MSKHRLGPRLWHFGWAIVNDEGLLAIITEANDGKHWVLMTVVDATDPLTYDDVQPMINQAGVVLRRERRRDEHEKAEAANRPRRSMIQEFQDQEDAAVARAKRRGR